MGHMRRPGFSIPSVGTPLHQMEADQQIVANPVYHPSASQQHNSHPQHTGHDSATQNGHVLPNQQQDQQQQNSLRSMRLFGSHNMNSGLSGSSMMSMQISSQKQLQSAFSFPISASSSTATATPSGTTTTSYQHSNNTNTNNNSNNTTSVIISNANNTPMSLSGHSTQQQQQQQEENIQQPHQTPQSLMSAMVPMIQRTDNISNIHNTIGPTKPLTPMTPPGSCDPGIVPQLQNIVSTVNLRCKLDLKKIALHARNAEYNPKRFSAVIMRIREPHTTALIFSSGKMVCTGAKSEDDSRLAARKYGRIIQKLGFPAKFADFKIQNMVGSCDVKFLIRLEALILVHATFSSYEPELFPGLIYRMVRPRVVLLIFASGKVVLTGAKVRQDIYEAFDKIFPILKKFKK